jgi:VanZ family protein
MFTTPAPQTPPRAAALMRTLSLLFAAAVIVATLYPLADWRLHVSGPLSFLGEGLPRWWTWFDVLSNALAYGVLALLVAIAWLERVPPWLTAVAVTAGASALSLSLEAAQSWLPGRVPSILDWLANSAGAAVGALLGATLNRAGQAGDRPVVAARHRWYEQGPPSGWVLLLLWLSAQLAPQRLMFATGHVEPALQRLLNALLGADAPDLTLGLAAWWGPSGTAAGVAIEAAVVMCAVIAIGSLAFALVQGPGRRAVLLVAIALAAFGLRSLATQAVYGSNEPFAWLTPGVQGGLVVGTALLYGLETLGERARSACALAAVAAGAVLVNFAPPDAYFATTGRGSSGALLNVHGLLGAVSLAWPVVAVVWFARRAVSAARRPI